MNIIDILIYITINDDESSMDDLYSLVMIKGLITVGRELRQLHPSDLLCSAGTSWERNHEGVVAVTSDRLWSKLIITWLNNVILHVFTTKYIQNHHQIERRHLLTSIVTLHISP